MNWVFLRDDAPPSDVQDVIDNYTFPDGEFMPCVAIYQNDADYPYVCTRDWHHGGPHVADTGYMVVAVWGG